jgi:hypothetical protein
MSFIAVVATLMTASADDTMELYKLPKMPKGAIGGQCMDGSPAAYYYRQAQNASSTSWVIFLQGGGACVTKSQCDSRATGALGSSTSYKQTVPSITPIMSLSSTETLIFTTRT